MKLQNICTFACFRARPNYYNLIHIHKYKKTYFTLLIPFFDLIGEKSVSVVFNEISFFYHFYSIFSGSFFLSFILTSNHSFGVSYSVCGLTTSIKYTVHKCSSTIASPIPMVSMFGNCIFVLLNIFLFVRLLENMSQLNWIV